MERRFGIILAAHGGLAPQMLASWEMLCGPQQGVGTAELSYGMGLAEMQAKLRAARAQLAAYDKVLVLADLVGGTPDNAALRLAAADEKLFVIGGANMPLLCELASCADELDAGLTASLAELARAGIRDETARLRSAKKKPPQDDGDL
ncbi:MAG: hypothetical protein VB021_08550 [Oscillospiraceae bacterium]|nr:hypothetical protein [Oscillospiraceae bacterium]